VASRNRNDPPAPAEPSPTFDVDRDGKIDGMYRPGDQRRSWTTNEYARFEMIERATRPQPAPEQPQTRQRPQLSARKVALAFTVIGATLVLPLAGGLAYRYWRDREPAAKAGLLIIDSHPSYGRVFIRGVEVGHTPYVQLNNYPLGSMVPARITYPGAQAWNGVFRGGVETRIDVELQAAQEPQH